MKDRRSALYVRQAGTDRQGDERGNAPAGEEDQGHGDAEEHGDDPPDSRGGQTFVVDEPAGGGHGRSPRRIRRVGWDCSRASEEAVNNVLGLCGCARKSTRTGRAAAARAWKARAWPIRYCTPRRGRGWRLWSSRLGCNFGAGCGEFAVAVAGHRVEGAASSREADGRHLLGAGCGSGRVRQRSDPTGCGSSAASLIALGFANRCQRHVSAGQDPLNGHDNGHRCSLCRFVPAWASLRSRHPPPGGRAHHERPRS